tara:strand:+ start:1451 stop:2143 length:693 start_codon:yes stop_codon:yes gene_type:complete
MLIFNPRNMTSNNVGKGIAEFVGTFFLTLTIFIAAVNGSAGAFAPLAIGLTLMVMIYALGHVSGAHFNPAVSIGLFLKGDCSQDELPTYLGAQILAGVLAFFVGSELVLNGADAAEITAATFDSTIAVLSAEALWTFALMFVIINVATEQAGNQFYGAAIGLTVMAGAFTVGGISLGSFNPAVTAMLTVSGKLAVADIWMHIVPQLLGAAGAVYTHKAMQGGAEAETPAE